MTRPFDPCPLHERDRQDAAEALRWIAQQQAAHAPLRGFPDLRALGPEVTYALGHLALARGFEEPPSLEGLDPAVAASWHRALLARDARTELDDDAFERAIAACPTTCGRCRPRSSVAARNILVWWPSPRSTLRETRFVPASFVRERQRPRSSRSRGTRTNGVDAPSHERCTRGLLPSALRWSRSSRPIPTTTSCSPPVPWSARSTCFWISCRARNAGATFESRLPCGSAKSAITRSWRRCSRSAPTTRA